MKDADFFPHVPGASEATLRFLADDTALCLLRLNNMPGAKTANAHLGVARPPYTHWEWKDLGAVIGGPNMIQLPDGRFVAAVRLYDKQVRTALCWLDPAAGKLTEFLTLPSGGDTSYAGLVLHDGLLWTSYYSSHEGKTSIYLAKVQIEAKQAERMTVTSVTPERGDAYPAGTKRITYRSAFDGAEDWALFLPGDPRKNTIVYLHGSFSYADQIFTRKDVREFWLTRIQAGRHPLLSVNMRGTSYMSPAATADLTELLRYCQDELGWQRFVLLGGSGGASSAMAYAVLHPEKVHGVMAMGMCDILARLDFARGATSRCSRNSRRPCSPHMAARRRKSRNCTWPARCWRTPTG